MSKLGDDVILMLRDRMAMPDYNGRVRNASGKTSKSFNYRDDYNRFTLFSDGSGAPIETLQCGSKPSSFPDGFVGIIAQWIIDKGLTVRQVPYKTDRPHKYTVEQRSLNLMAGAIAHSIVESGTERYRKPSTDLYTPVQEYVIDQMKKRGREIIIKDLLK